VSIRTYLLCLIVLLYTGLARANEITLPYKGLTLNADLTLAQGKTIADGVILITHGALAHRDMELLVAIRNLLRDKTYNTLAINLSLGVDNRHGMYDCKRTHRHLNDDAAREIGVWVKWLHSQGATRIALLGHSRGGAQTAQYAAENDSSSVKAVILLAPAVAQNTSAAEYQQRSHKPFAPLLDQARKLVKQGKGNTVLTHTNILFCQNTSATAAAFLSYYGQSMYHDTPSVLPKITKPTLILWGDKDEEVGGLDKKMAPLADGKRIQFKVINGADHFFRDLYAEDAVDAIDAFLKDLGF
jgi:pimeloyl-ACP methyl ester carboxylesterase